MDMRLILLLAAIALLQSLFAKKRARGQGDEAPDEADALPGGGGFAEGLGAPERGGTAGQPDRDAFPSDRVGAGAPGHRAARARGEVPGHGAAGARAGAPGPGRAQPQGAVAAPGRPKGGFLAELLREIEAQASKGASVPSPGGSTPPQSSRRAGSSASAATQAVPEEAGLPTFGVPEPVPSEASRRPPARVHDQPREAADPWALESTATAWEPVPEPAPAPRPPRSSSRRRSASEPQSAPAVARPPSSAVDDGGAYGLRNRDSLKRVIVAREVLGPPLALRKTGQEASWQ